MAKVHCRECGVSISETAGACPKCGAKQKGVSGEKKQVSRKTALLLAIFLGWLGADRFYMGHYGIGAVKLFTFGGLAWWWFIDIFLIASKKITSVEWVE